MDVKFFDSMYEGDSSNGVKLGMGLTGGDFWPRVMGCQNLYCGDCFYEVDFKNILLVTDLDTKLIDPGQITHEPDTTYLYVLRRANCCGEEEQSLAAVIKVEFDADGNLVEPCCNNILSIRAEQFKEQSVRLVWYYCPVNQQSQCICFKVYFDNGSGVVDFENELCTVNYTRPGLYCYETDVLTGDEYIFCVKAVSDAAVINGLSGEISVQISHSAPPDVGLLFAETF